MSVQAQSQPRSSSAVSASGMKRLVYSPRAYVYVKDSSGKIHDLTHYVTSGEVNRLVDQVSTATINLRNPQHHFTAHASDGVVKEPIFRPMDPITIYLRRVRQRPVRVFTGFLDRVPYAQLLPGVVTMRASCTLKRLLYTYFDPALPYTRSFLTNYGWFPYNGQWVSLTGMKEWLPPGVAPDPNKPNQTPVAIGGASSKMALFGDSIAEGIAASGVLGSNVSVRQTKVGRQTVDTLIAIKSVTHLPETVIVASGSNDDPTDTTAFKSHVEDVLRTVGDKRHLIWVNLHGTNYAGQDLTNLNPTLDSEATKHSNMTVVHWDSIVSRESVHLDSHGLHPDSAGYKILASEILRVKNAGAQSGASDANKLQPPKNIDGSLSQLLMATMQYIGHWDKSSVYIESMPEALFDHLRDLATEFANDSKEAQEEFKTLMKNILGAGSHGSPTGDSGATLGGEVKGMDNITQTIKSIADKFNVDPAMAMAVADIESNYGKNMFTHEPYHGWYQIDIGGSRYSKPITVAQANDLKYSCTLFCKGAANSVPDSVKKQSPLAWAMATQGVTGSNNPGYPLRWPSSYAKAKQYISQYGNGTLSGSVGQNSLGGTAIGADKTIRSTKKGGNKGGAGKIYAPIKGGGTTYGRGWHESSKGITGQTDTSGHVHWHSGIDIPVPAGTPCVAPVDGVITMSTLNWSDGGMVHFKFTKDVGNIKAGTIIGWGHVEKTFVSVGQHVSAGEIVALSGHPSGGDHVHFVTLNSETGGGDGTFDPKPIFLTLQKGEANPTGTATPIGNNADGTTGNTQMNPSGDASAGAFFASLDLPSMYDSVEASMLTGEKSLLNDKPLLPFIQQLCQASLRHFQSLPDGRFYAFYPDYFGEMNQHPPYWNIDDIEILDGKIELSDDSVVTHMYVVGDTTNPMANGETPFALRSVFSSGVVTVYNAFMANDVLDRTKARKKDKQQAQRKAKDHKQSAKTEENGMGILLDRKEVSEFLNRYGARPVVEDMPMIKSPYFEMFLAYQKFLLAWSKQFSTPFTFTFMPELFPGGKVGFPGHGLQMYIEEVNHSWDYESGFTTTASLTAPSVYGTDNKLLPPNMVQGIIKPAITPDS